MPKVEDWPMEVHAPSWRNTFDTGNIITIVTLFVAGGVAWGVLTSKVDSTQALLADRDRAYADRRAQTDNHFAVIDAKIAPLDATIYRLGKQESETANVNTRVDRIVDSFSDQLKDLRKDVNSIGTKIEVLTTTIADQNRRRESQGMLTKPPD